MLNSTPTVLYCYAKEEERDRIEKDGIKSPVFLSTNLKEIVSQGKKKGEELILIVPGNKYFTKLTNEVWATVCLPPKFIAGMYNYAGFL